MSDEVEFASLPVGYFDDVNFVWPATESRQSPEPARSAKPVIPISRSELRDLRAFRKARSLARRWEAEDDEVTVRDIIDALVRPESPRSP